MKTILAIIAFVLITCNAATAGTIHIFASHTQPAAGHSPAALIVGNPSYHRNPVLQPNQIIYIWAHTEPGQLFDAIGLNVTAQGTALISGPVVVPNWGCRWNGFVTGTPAVPPPVAFISGIKMVCVPTVTCTLGVS